MRVIGPKMRCGTSASSKSGKKSEYARVRAFPAAYGRGEGCIRLVCIRLLGAGCVRRVAGYLHRRLVVGDSMVDEGSGVGGGGLVNETEDLFYG